MTPARSDFYFKKNLQMKSLLSSMASSQCFLQPKVGVEGELISKKSLSPKIFDQGKDTSDLNTKGFSGGIGYGLRRMSELNI